MEVLICLSHQMLHVQPSGERHFEKHLTFNRIEERTTIFESRLDNAQQSAHKHIHQNGTHNLHMADCEKR